MPNGLLLRRRLVDGPERQGDFDEFLAVSHSCDSCTPWCGSRSSG
jgi:hypothetical protein